MSCSRRHGAGVKPGDVAAAGDSRQRWLARYAGGWQQLVPNAGDPRSRGRGRAGLSRRGGPRPVADDSRQRQLPLPRRRAADRPVAAGKVRDRQWWLHLPHQQHHQPVRRPGSRSAGSSTLPSVLRSSTTAAGCTTGARRALAAGHPLSLNEGDAVGAYPLVPDGAGSVVDVGTLPAPNSGRALFATLTDFTSPWFAVVSPTAGFGMGSGLEGDDVSPCLAVGRGAGNGRLPVVQARLRGRCGASQRPCGRGLLV